MHPSAADATGDPYAEMLAVGDNDSERIMMMVMIIYNV